MDSVNRQNYIFPFIIYNIKSKEILIINESDHIGGQTIYRPLSSKLTCYFRQKVQQLDSTQILQRGKPDQIMLECARFAIRRKRIFGAYIFHNHEFPQLSRKDTIVFITDIESLRDIPQSLMSICGIHNRSTKVKRSGRQRLPTTSKKSLKKGLKNQLLTTSIL